MGEGADGPRQPLAAAPHDPRGQRSGAGQRNLLTEHRADGQLVTVDMADHPPPGRGAHQRPDQGVAAERVDDGVRIGVEVEQRARSRHRGAKVAQVVQGKAWRARTSPAGSSSTIPLP